MSAIPGPPALAKGEAGAARIPGGPRLGALTSWRVVLSPTTGKHTLLAEGHFTRYYTRETPARAEATVTPTPLPARIGRPTPPTLAPFVISGRVALLTPTLLTIAEGEIRPV
jgi:hypothetical protein